MKTSPAPWTAALPSALLFTLCGCSTVSVSERFLPGTGEQRPPGTARVYIHVGNIVPYYWVDWGEGAPRNALIRRVDVNSVPPSVKLPADTLEELLLQPIQRPPKNEGWAYSDNSPVVVCLDAPSGRRIVYPRNVDTVSIPITDSAGAVAGANVWEPSHLLARSNLPLDACLIGRLGRGGTMIYDRPPGALDLDVFTPTIIVGRHGAAFAHLPISREIEAGKTYHVYWKWGYKFEIQDEATPK